MTDCGPKEARAEAAYRQAAKLIERGRCATAERRQVDLRPVQPAIAALCTLIRAMPADLARSWIERLNVLLRELHALGAEVAALEAFVAAANAERNRSGGAGKADESADGEGDC